MGHHCGQTILPFATRDAFKRSLLTRDFTRDCLGWLLTHASNGFQALISAVPSILREIGNQTSASLCQSILGNETGRRFFLVLGGFLPFRQSLNLRSPSFFHSSTGQSAVLRFLFSAQLFFAQGPLDCDLLLLVIINPMRSFHSSATLMLLPRPP